MASLTVRKLDEDVKKRLRLRAAANGRSMEEEVRLLLAEGAAEHRSRQAASDREAIKGRRARGKRGEPRPAASCSSSAAASPPTNRST